MESSGHNRTNISPPNSNKMLNFWQVGIFHHALSKYTNESHNFKNSNICDITLWDYLPDLKHNITFLS